MRRPTTPLVATVLVTAASTLVLVPASRAEAAPPTTACSAQAQDDGLVPVLQLPVPASGTLLGQAPAYTYDDTAAVAGGFDRVGYCLETSSGAGDQWVWSAMEPFTTDAAKLGLPTMPGTIVRQRVDDLTVDSNVPSVRTGAGQTGYVEMWPYTYDMAVGRQVAGASPMAYDTDDKPSTGGGYGSFQVHSVGAQQTTPVATTAPQTVLAINHFSDLTPGQTLELGIGTAPTGQPDWTFAANAAAYSARTLTVYARPSSVALTAAPADRQLFPRDAAGGSDVRVAGTVTAPGVDAVRLTVTRTGQAPVVTEQTGSSFAFAPRIEAGLHAYDLRLETVSGGVARTVQHWTDIVSGDAYFIQGQSNAQAAMYTPGSTALHSPYIRSYGSNVADPVVVGADKVWHYAAGDLEFEMASVGQWAMAMADDLMRTEQVPVAIVNGAHGGAPIGFLQRNDANPDDLGTNYGRTRQRLVGSGLMDKLSGVFFYQGESENEDAALHVAGVRSLLADWRDDLGGARGAQAPYYVIQVRTTGCGGVNGVALREAQRRLGETDGVTLMSTNGLPGHDGCHYTWDGYRTLGLNAADTVRRDVFDGPSDGVAAPNPVSAELATREGHEVVVQLASATDDLDVDAGVGADFRLVGSTATVTDVRYEQGGRLVLTLSRPAPETTGVSYHGHLGDGPMITTSRGIGLLAFGSLPVANPSDHERAVRSVLTGLAGLGSTADDLRDAGDLTAEQAGRVTDGVDEAAERVQAALAVVQGGSGDEGAELLAAIAVLDELAAWVEGSALPQPVLGQLRRLVADLQRDLDGVTVVALGITADVVRRETPVLPGDEVSGQVRVASATRALRDVAARVVLDGWDVDDSGAVAATVAAGASADLPFTATVPDTQQPGAVTPQVEVTLTTDHGTFVVPLAAPWVDVTAQAGLESVSAAPAVGGPGGRVLVTADVVNGADTPLAGRLVVTAPAGWSTQAAATPITVAPGSRLSSTVPVTVPIDVVSGAYPTRVVLRRGGVEVASAPVTLTVNRTTPPTAGVTDHVDFGDGASEAAHALQASASSGTNVEAGLSRRYSFATVGNFFSAEVDVPASGKPFVLRAIETFDGPRTKRYDVLVDGVRVKRMDFTRTDAGQGTLSHDVLVDDPAVLDHDGTVRVRYEYPAGVAGAADPSIADLWVLDVGGDTTAPDVSATVGGDQPGLAGWQRGPATVTVDAVDDRDRAPAVEIGVDAGWQPYTGPVTIAGEGRRSVTVRATDATGNRSTETVPVWVDATAPTTTLGVRTDGDRALLDLAATDTLSGVERTSYRVDGGPWARAGEQPALVEELGDHVVEYRSVDVAGNREPLQRATVRVSDVEVVTALAPPTISGVPRIGSRLASTTGTWNTGGLTFTRQWLRNGMPIAGATGASYVVTGADVGKRISVRVTASRPGLSGAASSIATAPVVKATSQTTSRLSSARVKAGRTVKVTATVTAAGVAPTGKVQVRVDGKVVRTLTLRNGKATTQVKVRRGSHSVVVRYLGSATTAPSAAPARTVRGR